MRRRLAIVFVITLLGVSTLALSQPGGLGAAADLLAAWVSRFKLGSGWSLPLRAIMRYEIAVVVLGVPAAVAALLHRDQFSRLLLLWIGLLLLLILVQAGELTNAALVTLPAALLVGRWLQTVYDGMVGGRVWLPTLAMGTWGLVALVNIGRYARLPASQIQPLLTVLLLLIIISFTALALLEHPRDGASGVAFGLLLLLLFFSWGTAWRLTHVTGNDPRELWTTAGTSEDVRMLRRTLREASYQLAGADDELALLSSVDNDVVRWYVRDFDDVSFAVAIPPGTTSTAVLTPAEQAPQLEGSYIRSDFFWQQVGSAMSSIEAGGDPPGLTITESLRWWFFGDHPLPLDKIQLSLWLRPAAQ
jgi:hypothetical protein